MYHSNSWRPTQLFIEYYTCITHRLLFVLFSFFFRTVMNEVMYLNAFMLCSAYKQGVKLNPNLNRYSRNVLGSEWNLNRKNKLSVQNKAV